MRELLQQVQDSTLSHVFVLQKLQAEGALEHMDSLTLV